MDVEKLRQLIERLQVVTESLEKYSASSPEVPSESAPAASGPGAKTTPPEASSQKSGKAASAASAEFWTAVTPSIEKLVEESKKCDTTVQWLTGRIVLSFSMAKRFLALASACVKPAVLNEPLNEPPANLFGPFLEVCKAIPSGPTKQPYGQPTGGKLDDPRGPHVHPCKAAVSICSSHLWLLLDDPPSYVEAMKEEISFSVTKVQQMRVPETSAWAKAVNELSASLLAYVKSKAPSGIAWGKEGGEDADAFLALHPLDPSKTEKAQGDDTQGPPKALPPKKAPLGMKKAGPPPPKKAGAPQSAYHQVAPKAKSTGGGETSAGGGMAAVFDEINKLGMEGMHQGLKHVTRDMKVKFDPTKGEYVKKDGGTTAEGGAGPPKTITGAGKKAPPGPKAGSKPPPPPSCTLQGKIWRLENYEDDKNVTVTPSLDQNAYIAACRKSTVRVPQKCNTIGIDGCKKVSVIAKACLSQIEAVNCDDIQIFVEEKVPAIALDKCTGVEIFLLSEESKACEIRSSKSSDMNVSFPAPTETDAENRTELPIPEAFVSRIEDGKLKTEVSSLYA
uniref:C-CAP/cofactor C-like domain-containing protein n=1 Tax=Chromera velia CCMP2878 TaxID=1169474 RepID=A0A0G4HTL7_9ALVE|eukprot:Cvel_8488.t1-p1 / transcript=Cvel_8488.t1 / gene=Cvel_8488 / organism=Chromera_velia_CCMP2878 / gene_product=Adenylyl cyclase-associated protein, putative / transcript_product=Adenylyl cyclase-associated protein, putative / location=Cvel_scaffold469:28187-34020(+) / protein_length=561 / sequence_SO=supercontig / SO=protein_coding / is_pseudo=false